MTPRRPSLRAGDGGFTLVEVVVSLVIVATAFIPLLASLGSSAEQVHDTTLHRQMRYLIGLMAEDVMLGPVQADQEEEKYEEGQGGTFEDFASEDYPTEYDGFEWRLDVYRDEIIVGGDSGTTDEDSFGRSGWEPGPSGGFTRPVSNDWLGEEDEETTPAGQMKRLVVLSVRRLGEDAEDDIEFRIMTYLPVPGEEERQLGEAAGAEAGGGAKPGEGGGDAKGDASGGAATGSAERK